jgi:hypothetical protein
MVSSNFPNRPFRLEEQVDTQTFYAENRSAARGRMWIRKNSYSPTWSGSNNSSYAFSLDGVQRAGNSFSYDFRNSDELQLCDVYIDQLYHDANGNRYFSIKGSANVDQMGYTEVNSGIQLPRITRAPDAPTPIGVDQPTTTSLRYRFSGNYDGGAPIRRWEVQAAYDPSFPVGVAASDGTYYATGLNPGAEVFFRARGVNDNGAGPWSGVVSGRTLGSNPAAPGDPQVVIVPPDKVTLSWTAPADTGGKPISSFTTRLSTSSDFTTGVTQQDVDAAARSQTFTGNDQIKPGSTFYLSVRANNVDNTGYWAFAGPFLMPAGGKAWTGSAWKTALWKVWTAAGAWKIAKVKTWTGTEWKVTK